MMSKHERYKKANLPIFGRVPRKVTQNIGAIGVGGYSFISKFSVGKFGIGRESTFAPPFVSNASFGSLMC